MKWLVDTPKAFYLDRTPVLIKGFTRPFQNVDRRNGPGDASANPFHARRIQSPIQSIVITNVRRYENPLARRRRIAVH
jgi:hypothetical protein